MKRHIWYRGGSTTKYRKKNGEKRSGLETSISNQLGDNAEYEPGRIPFTQPEKQRNYTPDFILKNGIIIEGKGYFETAADRAKFVMLKKQYGDSLDIRFIFSSAKTKIYKGSKTTYGMWADKLGFQWSEKIVPKEWINEPQRTNPWRVLIAKNK